MPTFVLKTFGCQFNELYSASVVEMLEHAGFEQSTALDQASLVVINTCAVREKSEEKAFSFLGEAAKAVDGSRIIFMGCTATLDRERAKRIAGHDLNIIPGTAGVEEVLARVQSVTGCAQPDPSVPRSLFPTADIEVVRGCESCCTYCIVPRARGGETVVEVAYQLATLGARVTLIHRHRKLAADLGPSTRWVVLKHLQEAGVPVVCGEALRLTPALLLYRGLQGEEGFIPAKWSVWAGAGPLRDPAQVDLPDAWRGLPTACVGAGFSDGRLFDWTVQAYELAVRWAEL